MILIAESISHLENGNANLKSNTMKTKCMSCGGSKMKAGGSTSFGMLSVKAGVDKNPKPTAADRIVGAKKSAGTMKNGGAVKKKK